MAHLSCNNPECPGGRSPGLLQLEVAGGFGIKGILSCLGCGHDRSIAMEVSPHGTYLQEVACLVGEQSKELASSVPKDIKDDIQEAERAHFAQCFKACVTMCRRALQLALIDKGIKDKPLSKMIADAKDLFNEKTLTMAISIKGFGDIGAHRKEKIEPEDARIAIYMTVKMLNELFS